ncbi:hypothetical protein ACPV3A_30530 [Paenibacillus sp. Dod16]|uniref:hypothetical protein n=1 Tax=Paenibacillus sp. Dod16 TaxID=3416392 RepID=UPI003CFA8781
MKNDINITFEIIKIILTAALAGFFTYWITFKKEREDKRYHANKELLEKVYAPIMKTISESIFPGDGYEGIRESDLNVIIKLIDDNSHIVDPRLDSFAWRYKEDMVHDHRINNDLRYEATYDEDRVFIDYLNYRYNLLRKKTFLNYDSSYFFFGKTKIKIWSFISQVKRRVRRIIRKLTKTKKY